MNTPIIPPQAGFIQFDVLLGRWPENLASVRRELERLKPGPGALIVLPELWATGFAYERKTALALETPALLAALQEEASRHGCLLAGSLMEAGESEAIYNTLFVTGGQGTLGSYRKQELFAPLGEDRHFTPGSSPAAVETPFGPLACLVCYDLRFPELAQLQTGQGAGLIAVAAQWPLARREHWRTLLKARAIENQAFVVACNRSGQEAGTAFAGASAIIGPDGATLVEAGEGPASRLITLDPGQLAQARGSFSPLARRPYPFPDEDKLMELPALRARLARQQALGRRVVFTNGCFDIIHQGHVSYLEAARRLGDCLVVGLNSDQSIRALKGPQRPVNPESSRARVLAALGCVDFVVIFGEETPLELIRSLKPDLLVKGADWPLDRIVGAPEVLARGGQVAAIPMAPGFSTTGMIQRIRGQD